MRVIFINISMFKKFAYVPHNFSEFLEEYSILDFGDFGIDLIGKAKFKEQKEFSQIGRDIFYKVRNCSTSDKIGFWLYFLAGSSKVPKFEIVRMDDKTVLLLENKVVFVNSE